MVLFQAAFKLLPPNLIINSVKLWLVELIFSASYFHLLTQYFAIFSLFDTKWKFFSCFDVFPDVDEVNELDKLITRERTSGRLL